MRGRGRSGGFKSDNLGLQVGRDGYDLVEWIAAQPWSDGRVVMYGGSFVGMTQWHTAAQHPPHLAAIAPYVPIYPGWDVPNTNGIPQAWSAMIMGYVSGRSLNTGFIANHDYWGGKLLEAYAAYRPFSEVDAAVGVAADDWWMMDDRGQKMSFVGCGSITWAMKPSISRRSPATQDYARMEMPVLSATGYYDDDQPGALRYYQRHVANAPAAAVAQHFLIIGPWDHSGTQGPTKEIEGLSIPDTAVIDMQQLHADWYDSALGSRSRACTAARPRHLLHDGRGRMALCAYTRKGIVRRNSAAVSWLTPEERPPDIFHSGSLATSAPKGEPPAVIVSDPRELPELEVAQYAESEDATSQFRAFQKRAIIFHSRAFGRATEVAGHMRLILSCAADAPDFDLWAQVLMVQSDGSAVRLGEDIRRARFRNSQFKAELLKPGRGRGGSL